MTENDALLWLLSISGISSRKALLALQKFQSAYLVWKYLEEPDKLYSVFSDKDIQLLHRSKKNFNIASYREKMKRHNIEFVSIFDEKFPTIIKSIPYPPLGLYVGGYLKNDFLSGELTEKSIALVGSRNPSLYGLEASRQLSFDLALSGYTIVSGLAKGLDSVAHKGALQAKGKTIAVLGNGLDICYPRDQAFLYDEIWEKGLLVSEYPLGQEPRQYTFPERNRIISGLSQALIVIESTIRSGTNITVNHALEQGKDVFAVPGSIFSEQSKGTNQLIFDGAYLALSASQIIETITAREFQNIYMPKQRAKRKNDNTKQNNPNKGEQTTKTTKKIVRQLEPKEKIVYDCIGSLGTSVDILASKTNMPVSELLPILLVLEIEQRIKKLPGQQYIVTDIL